MTFPILRHQNAPHIRVPSESNAEQVENFALKILAPGQTEVSDSIAGLALFSRTFNRTRSFFGIESR